MDPENTVSVAAVWDICTMNEKINEGWYYCIGRVANCSNAKYNLLSNVTASKF